MATAAPEKHSPRPGERASEAAMREAQESKPADEWADYASLAEVTKTRSGFPVIRSLAGSVVLVTNLTQDETSKAYLADIFGTWDADSKTIDTTKAGKYVVPPTYAKKMAAALKAKPPTQKGIRISLREQKRGVGLS